MIDENTKIECISCFENRRIVLRGIDLISSKGDEKRWLVSWQCPVCRTCQSTIITKGGRREQVYEYLKGKMIYADILPFIALFIVNDRLGSDLKGRTQ